MVPIQQIVILAIIQGITEFLPISSTAHLILLPKLAGWDDQGLAIDVAVHFGTLGAVVVYFWKDVWNMTTGGVSLLRGKVTNGGVLFLQIVLATIPVVIVGAILSTANDGLLRQVTIIAWASILFGVLLYAIDLLAPTKHTLKKMTYAKSLLVGLAQAIAFIPGASRAGTCITALRLLGFNRPEAAHYSCLMSIPTILAAATLVGIKLYNNSGLDMCLEAILAAVLAFVMSLLSIVFMMRWVSRTNYGIFVAYRVLLGFGLLGWIYYFNN